MRTSGGDVVIRVEHLRKAYGPVVAVDDVSFEVRRGEIFGIVGPNGAGKTTTVESMTGMRTPDHGRVEVLGHDPNYDGTRLRRRIGVQLQHAALPDRIKVWEVLDLYSSFYERAVDPEKLMEQWGLAEKRDVVFDKLSGGQKQRLFIALALLNDPEVVFLDEITSGLDPQARRASWDLVRSIRDEGKTVVLVTHFMDEAEQLCDRVAIVDRGKVVALDSPGGLIGGLDAEMSVSFTAENDFDPALLEGLLQVSEVRREGERISVRGSGPLLTTVVTALARQNVIPQDLKTEQATLEDVFIALTGRRIRD